MRTIKTFAVVLAMACVGTSGLAQPYTGAGKKVPADQWMPQAARPYSSQEIYFQPVFHQQVPEIRVTQIEAAYTKRQKSKEPPHQFLQDLQYMKLDAMTICKAHIEALKHSHNGAAVSDHGCRPDAGLAKTSSKNSARGAMSVHYHKGTAITENLAIAITVCEPKEKYDAVEHICISDEGEKR